MSYRYFDFTCNWSKGIWYIFKYIFLLAVWSGIAVIVFGAKYDDASQGR